YSPIRQNDASRARRNTVLGTMVRDGFINLDEAAAAAQEPIAVAEFDPARESVAPYFIDYVNRVLERPHPAGGAQASSLQTDRAESDSIANRRQDAGEPQAGMPALRTTLDLDLQRAASDAIAHQLERL